MKFALLAITILAAPFAQAADVKLDSGVVFQASSADCQGNVLTVMRRFRAEKYSISSAACAVVQSSTQPFNVMGLDDAGQVVVVGYTQDGAIHLAL